MSGLPTCVPVQGSAGAPRPARELAEAAALRAGRPVRGEAQCRKSSALWSYLVGLVGLEAVREEAVRGREDGDRADAELLRKAAARAVRVGGSADRGRASGHGSPRAGCIFRTLAARKTRIAISPRLATRSFLIPGTRERVRTSSDPACARRATFRGARRDARVMSVADGRDQNWARRLWALPRLAARPRLHARVWELIGHPGEARRRNPSQAARHALQIVDRVRGWRGGAENVREAQRAGRGSSSSGG